MLLQAQRVSDWRTQRSSCLGGGARQLTPHTPYTTHHTSHFTHHTSHHTPHTSHLTPHTTHLTPHTSHTTQNTSYTTHLTPYTSHLTPHTSHLTPHTSHLTPHATRHKPHATRHTPHATRHTPHATPDSATAEEEVREGWGVGARKRELAQGREREKWRRARKESERRHGRSNPKPSNRGYRDLTPTRQGRVGVISLSPCQATKNAGLQGVNRDCSSEEHAAEGTETSARRGHACIMQHWAGPPERKILWPRSISQRQTSTRIGK